MKSYRLIFSTLFLFLLSISCLRPTFQTTPTVLKYPGYWPKPEYDFHKNPLTKEGIQLGKRLFYEPLLSKSNTISCSSCHLSNTAFTNVDHVLSRGINDSVGKRNSPVLINLAWGTSFMWDGAINHLDVQALAPITHPAEMGEDLNDVITKLSETDEYPQLFKNAYGSSTITGEYLLKSISQFQLTLVSANSKYDKMIREEIVFNAEEDSGYKLFQRNCVSCHVEPLFTNGGFANNGLAVDTLLNDLGRVTITGQIEDSLKFKIPTLRNIECSQPYMHDGRFKSLVEVLNHYTDGIVDSKTVGVSLQTKVVLSSKDKLDVIAFLLTLTDQEFLTNTNFSIPQN
jgi:cytochrome c peroxidase